MQNSEAPQVITQTPNNFNDLIYKDTIEMRYPYGTRCPNQIFTNIHITD